VHRIVQAKNETVQHVTVTALVPLSQMGDLTDVPMENGTSVRLLADSPTEVSRMLDRPEEATDTVKAWKNAVDLIKRVMDAVRLIVEVCIFSLHLLLS
jgi:hypothetical protein